MNPFLLTLLKNYNEKDMTQEEKELVIKDICIRLPYGVIEQVNDGLKGTYDSRLVQVFCDRLSCSVSVYNPLKECICIDSVKPYLRPMSSMTEEEKNEFALTVSPQGSAIYYNEYIGIPSSHLTQEIPYKYLANVLDWLNAYHFDYRGLIPKGLAISTEEFNPYKD